MAAFQKLEQHTLWCVRRGKTHGLISRKNASYYFEVFQHPVMLSPRSFTLFCAGRFPFLIKKRKPIERTSYGSCVAFSRD